MAYATEEHLYLLQAFDNHLKWLVEGYNDQDKDANLEFDTLFEFHTRKLQGLLQDLADYFGAHKQYVSREPDIQADSTGGRIDPNSLGMYPGVPVAEREKVKLHKKYGDVFNDEAKNIDERWR